MAGVSDPPPLILVADDDKLMRLQLRLALEKEGYRIEAVENGLQCLAAYSQLQPDMVLLDGMMPELDGFDCCAQIQKIQQESTEPYPPPILLITSLEDQGSVDLAFQSGAADYITKPVHWAVLIQRVRRLLQQYSQSRQIGTLLKQLEQANRELQRQATIDGLTQVANRRRFDDYLEQEWKRLARDPAPLSLIMTDVDFFKAYNDTYGHLNGDDCLRTVAQALNLSVKRPADLVARYGGEEFAVILPNTVLSGAILVAEEIRSNIAAMQIPHTASKYGHLTLSLGVATVIPESTLPTTNLITQADQALYQAKLNGRNQVIASGS